MIRRSIALDISERSPAALRLAVLAGGDSSERAVSLASGRCVARALRAAGHEVTCIDPQVAAAPSDCSSSFGATVLRGNSLTFAAACGQSTAAVLSLPESAFRPACWDEIEWRSFDACFLALHGGAGENGQLQQFLESRGICFTGPRAAAARLAMSKVASKRRFDAAGVPTPDYHSFGAGTPLAALLAAAARLGYPLIVKPDAQGSSIGISLVHDRDELTAAVIECRRYDAKGLLERYIPGREFTVAIVGRDPLPLIEIGAAGPIFSYAEKYESAEPHHRFDCGLAAADEHAIVAAALDAARALDTDSLVRVDVRLDAQGHPSVLELNAIPGMTESSLAPLAARRAGLDMPAFCDLLVRQCLQRGASR